MTKSSKRTKNASHKERSSKEERLFQNLLKIIEQFMAGKGFKPLTQDELMERLALPPPTFRDLTVSVEVLNPEPTNRGCQRAL